MNAEEIKRQIESALPGTPLKMVRETILVENPKDITKVASFLKDSEYKLDYLSSVTGADYLQFLETVYHFYSIAKNHRVRIKVRLEEKDAVIESLSAIWPGANWFEREVWDMFAFVSKITQT